MKHLHLFSQRLLLVIVLCTFQVLTILYAPLSHAKQQPLSTAELSTIVVNSQDLLFRQVYSPDVKVQLFDSWLKKKHSKLQQQLDYSEYLRNHLFPATITARNPDGYLLNNFKQKKRLSHSEQQQWFQKEWLLYQKNKRSSPLKFDLKYLNLSGISSFDYVLFPNRQAVNISPIQTIENPLKKVKGSHPNHTILAGNQPVLSAGNMTVINKGSRRLIFISNKSGHFLPEYKDLKFFKQFLIDQGIPAEQIFTISMASFYANTVYKYFYRNQLEINLNLLNPEKVYRHYLQNWKASFEQGILSNMLQRVREKGFQATKSDILMLKKDRKSAHYLRSAFYLFDRNHRPPSIFENYVIQYGKLNDGLIYQNQQEIDAASRQLKLLLPQLIQAVDDFSGTNEMTFSKHFQQNYQKIQSTLAQTPMFLHDMHMMRIYYKQYLNLYKTMRSLLPYQALVEVNIQHLENVITHLGDLHDLYVEQSIKGEIEYKKYQLKFNSKELKYFKKVIDKAHQPLLKK